MRLSYFALAAALLGPASAQAADPSALWKIVNGQCVPHEEATHDPSPCTSVDIAEGTGKGFVVLKDINGASQFLLIPTARIAGIEDPQILSPDATNYWDKAWQAHYFVEERLQTTLPRDAMSLAINSPFGRTQDQLHIHIDCVNPAVRDALRRNLDRIVGVWTPFPEKLAGEHYRSLRINQDTLDGVNPFRLLADSDPRASDEMNRHTLVVVGETFSDGTNGFVLLDDRADPAAGDFASGERLQDHDCAVAKK
jgi:CDP-diacylglycerol pyrophosphatase